MTTISPEDAKLLKDSIREALRALSDSAEVRRVMATARGFDDKVWQRLSGELGLPALTLPEEYGGAGMSEEELAIALEEAGDTLLCAPLFATAALAVPLLRSLGDAAALAQYGPPIAAGDLTATVALTEDGGHWRPDAVRCTATPTPDGRWLLDGVKNYVVDGATAGLILVVARTATDDLAVFAVPGDAPGLAAEQLVTLDQTRKQARLVLTQVKADRVGAGDATEPIARATAVSRALLAVEQVGGAQHCLDMTVEYAKTRIQFARPIGSFQAVKQTLAQMLVLVESARSAAYAAVTAAATDDPELEHVAAIAALTVGETYTWVTEETIQLHGGMGFTWEHDAHLYFKRARSSALQLGTAAELADLIGTGLAASVE